MKKKKYAAAITAAITLAAAMSGCGNSSDPEKLLNPKNPVTITIWHYYNGVQQTNFDDMVKEFNETVGFEKGIIVEAFSKSSINELANSVVAAVQKDAGAEAPPDIFATYSETAYKLDRMGAVADVKKYLTEEEIAEYVPEYIEEGAFSGSDTIKIFPTAKSTEVLMLNKTDWDKFAASEGAAVSDLLTVEGVVRTAEKYYNYTDRLTPDVPNDGKALFGRDSVANYMYIGAKQLGCEFVETDENGAVTVTITKDALRKLWDNYYVPYVKGYFTAQSRFRSDDAKTGAIISMVCSTTASAYFPSEVTIGDDYSYPIENVTLPCPYFEGTEPYLVQQGAGMSVLKSDAPSEYASIVFLKWFTEEDRNIRFSAGSGYLPVKKSANSYDKLVAINGTLDKPMDDTMLGTFRTAMNDVTVRKLYTSAPFDRSAEVRDYLGDTMQATAADCYSAAKARIDAGEDRDAVLADYVSDEAFDRWFDSFISGLSKTASE